MVDSWRERTLTTSERGLASTRQLSKLSILLGQTPVALAGASRRLLTTQLAHPFHMTLSTLVL